MGILVALAMVAAAPAAGHTQEPAPGAQPSARSQELRNQIHLMEGVLANAGSLAAEAFGRRLKEIEPSMSVFIGNSRARGWILDDYGIFFDVEVPELRATIVLAEAMVQRDLQIGNALLLLKRALKDMPQGPSRQQAEQALNVLDLYAGPAQPPQGAPAASVSASAADRAIRVSEGGLSAPEAAAPPVELTTAPILRPDQEALMRNPRREYRDTVQRQLTEVMLDYARAINIAPDQWLSVAARVTEAGQRGETLMLRVRGSDLALFAADQSRRDEIRRRVEVRVF